MIYQYTYFELHRMDKEIKSNKSFILILSILFLASLIIAFIRIPQLIKSGQILPQGETKVELVANQANATSTHQILTIRQVVAEKQREVTAYNVGDASQTDNSPCIGASGVDICNLLDHDICVYAANFVPIGTYLEIDGVECQVLDRLNSKYPKRVDIAMKLSEKQQAIKFGVQTKTVRVIK
jgi:3D (Asp-Asp-Asp) domain-containing protein